MRSSQTTKLSRLQQLQLKKRKLSESSLDQNKDPKKRSLTNPPASSSSSSSSNHAQYKTKAEKSQSIPYRKSYSCGNLSLSKSNASISTKSLAQGDPAIQETASSATIPTSSNPSPTTSNPTSAPTLLSTDVEPSKSKRRTNSLLYLKKSSLTSNPFQSNEMDDNQQNNDSLTALLGISQGEASKDGNGLDGPLENANSPINTKEPETTHTPSSDISRTPEPSLENLVESPKDLNHQNILDKPISPILTTTAQSPTVAPPQPQAGISTIIDPINSIKIDPTKLLNLSQLTKSMKTPSVWECKKPKKFTFLSPFQNNAWENQGHFKDLEDQEDANQSDDECSRSTHPSRITFDFHVQSKTKTSKEDLDDIRDIELQDTQPLDDHATEKKDDGVNTNSYTIDLDELDKKAFKPEEEEKSKQSLIVKLRKPVIKPDNLKLLRVLKSNNSHKDYINTKEFLSSMHSQSQNEAKENQSRSNINGNGMKSESDGVIKNELLTKFEWNIKTSVSFISPIPFESLSYLSSIQECTALNKYVKEGTGLESTMSLPLQIHQLLHYYIYPTQSLPASLEKTLPTLLSKSIETLKEAERMEVEWYISVEAEWKKSFRSLYLSLRNNLIPYFYYTHQQEFSILFIASHISKSKRIEAVVTQSTTGLRRRLEMEGIEFEMPLADKLKPKVIPKNYVVADEDSDLQSDAETDDHDDDDDDDDDENKMKEGRKEQNLIPNHQPELLDNLPASLLVIMGTLNVNSLFKFLLGYGSGTVSTANSSSQKDFGLGENRLESKFQTKGRNQKTVPAGALKNRGIKYGNIQLPRLISPGVFEGAGVKKCEITRNGPIQRSSKSSTETLYRFQIQGYILPHALYHLKRILFSFAKCGVLESRTHNAQKTDNENENQVKNGNKENSLEDRTSHGPVVIRDENVLEVSTKVDEETVVVLERCVDVELWG